MKKIFFWLAANKKMVGILIFFVVFGGVGAIFTDRYLLEGRLRGLEAAVTLSEQNIGGQNAVVDSEVLGVAVVGTETIAGNEFLSTSWPGEIISSEISQIQPQREGVITNWRVRIGDAVSAGDVLGKISAPPATPELIAMLAEQTEALARAKAQASVADEFAAKEQLRFSALRNSIDGNTTSTLSFSFTALESMRKKIEVKRVAVRSFVEQAISGHVLMVSVGSVTDWRYFRSLNREYYGQSNQSIQNAYELSLLTLINKLKSSTDLPIENAQDYFALVVRLANSSGDEAAVNGFKTMVAADQKEFLEMLGDYRMAQAEVADKETEYKIMLSENSAMVEKDRSMAYAEVKAMEASYNTVAKEITGGLNIIAPRPGIISAIYKKVGDLVDPTMPIAVIAGRSNSNLIVRMSIPNNIRRPAVGEMLSVVRPGFPMDIRQIKITGVGTSLDEMGSYMADATLIDHVDWPVGASVRVIAPQNSSAPVIKLSSVWWSEESAPNVWGVSEAGRIFPKKITIGRTLGILIEVYEGLKNGDRYIISPTPNIREDMLLEDIAPEDSNTDKPAGSGGKTMGEMEM